MPVVSVADAQVHYEVAGEGPGLVLVHGTSGSGQAHFGHLLDGFTADRTVVLPDYSGSAETSDGGGPLTVEGLAAQVAAVARAAVDGPVDVAGFSLGAVVAAATAALQPELVRRLVLIAGWAHGDDARHRLNFELWRDLLAADPELFKRFGTLTGFSPAFLSAAGREGVEMAIAGLDLPPGLPRQIDLDLRADLRALLPDIAAPTLVVGMTQDQMVPPAGPRALHEAIAGSRYAEIDSGHVVIFERPEELVALIREFIL